MCFETYLKAEVARREAVELTVPIVSVKEEAQAAIEHGESDWG